MRRCDRQTQERRDITNPEHRKYIAGVWGVEESTMAGPGVDAYEISTLAGALLVLATPSSSLLSGLLPFLKGLALLFGRLRRGGFLCW